MNAIQYSSPLNIYLVYKCVVRPDLKRPVYQLILLIEVDGCPFESFNSSAQIFDLIGVQISKTYSIWTLFPNTEAFLSNHNPYSQRIVKILFTVKINSNLLIPAKIKAHFLFSKITLAPLEHREVYMLFGHKYKLIACHIIKLWCIQTPKLMNLQFAEIENIWTTEGVLLLSRNFQLVYHSSTLLWDWIDAQPGMSASQGLLIVGYPCNNIISTVCPTCYMCGPLISLLIPNKP